MMMISGHLPTRHVYSASIWVSWFDCRVLLPNTKSFFSAWTKTLQSSVWDCNQVVDWIQNEHAERSLFSLSCPGWPTSSRWSQIWGTKKRFSAPVICYSHARPSFSSFCMIKYDKTSWPCWADPVLKILLNKKIRYFACGLGTDVDQHLFTFHLVFMQSKPGQPRRSFKNSLASDVLCESYLLIHVFAHNNCWLYINKNITQESKWQNTRDSIYL